MLVQEAVRGNATLADASVRCAPLAASIRPEVTPAGLSRIGGNAATCGPVWSVLSCTFGTELEATRDAFVEWVNTSPLPPNPNACVPLRVAETQHRQYPTLASPPLSPPSPWPPRPPARPAGAPVPSPPPPPPSPPPAPPVPPVPPAPPPSPPPRPPSPPFAPALPASPPLVRQLIQEPLCHNTCTQWAYDALQANPAAQQSYACGGIYGSACNFETASASLLDGPPVSPPPPLPPDSELTLLQPSRVLASEPGFDPRYTAAAEAVTVCTDDGQDTPCAVSPLADPPWLMFDLGAQHTGLVSARLWLIPPHPPTPPSAPPDPPPSASPMPPPPPPPSPKPSPPPPNRRLSEEYMDAGGALELWVSRARGLFGTRAATIDTARLAGAGLREVGVRLTEGSDPSEGRYIFVRSWRAGTPLAIDGLRVYAASTGRRLAEAEAPPKPLHLAVERMRNATAAYCDAETAGQKGWLPGLRLSASMLWSALDEEQSNYSCTDCLTRRYVNCTDWFAWHAPDSPTAAQSRMRASVYQQLEETRAARTKAIEESFARSCCRTSKKTGQKECGKQFCERAMLEQVNPRKAHILRRMHERDSPVKLTVPELVATDVVGPHLHHDARCDSVEKRQAHGELECLATSLARHLGDKHGFDVDEKLSQYGLSLAGMLTAQLKTATAKRPAYASDPTAAERARRVRDESETPAERRRRQLHAKAQQRALGGRAEWMRAEGRKLEEAAPVLVAVSATGVQQAKSAYAWADNASHAARQLLRTADRKAAAVGAPSPLRERGIAKEALLSTLGGTSTGTGALLGKGIDAIGSLASLSERGTDIYAQMQAQREAEASARREVAPRRLQEREHRFYDEVDAATGGGGFTLPEWYLRDYGWVAGYTDWVHVHDEVHRVAGRLLERQEHAVEHARRHGVLPHGSVQAPTGYGLFDLQVPPSRLGDAIRGLLPEHKRRKLQEVRGDRGFEHARRLRELPMGGERKSVVAAFFQASIEGRDPFDAAWHALEAGGNQHTMTRRLSEYATGGWLGGAQLILPVKWGQQGFNLFQELGRYIIYDGFLW